MGMHPQVLKIIFEVQRKMSNEKVTRREISFPTYKTHFFPLFLVFGPFMLPYNFLIYYSF
jgi:hypothetical protein